MAIGEGHAIPRAMKMIHKDDTELHSHSDLDRTATRIQSLALFFRTAPQTMDCQLSHSLRPSSAIPFNRSPACPSYRLSSRRSIRPFADHRGSKL